MFRPLLAAEADVLLTFFSYVEQRPVIEQEVLCQPIPYALVRKGHPLDQDGKPVTLEEVSAVPQLAIEDGPAVDFFSEIFCLRGLVASNVSTNAHALIGTSDQVSPRVVHPAHDLSPLGHRLAFLPIVDLDTRPILVIASVQSRYRNWSAKVAAFIKECHAIFA